MELPENHPFAVKKRVSGLLLFCYVHCPTTRPHIAHSPRDVGIEGVGSRGCQACPVVHAQVTKDEEKLQEERLKVTQGLPLQDLAGAPAFFCASAAVVQCQRGTGASGHEKMGNHMCTSMPKMECPGHCANSALGGKFTL